jgi:hypothetical protein
MITSHPRQGLKAVDTPTRHTGRQIDSPENKLSHRALNFTGLGLSARHRSRLTKVVLKIVPFARGHSKVGGRVQGTPNKNSFVTVRERLEQLDLDPLEEAIRIARDKSSSMELKAKIWLAIMDYTEAKPQRALAVSLEPEAPTGPGTTAREVLLSRISQAASRLAGTSVNDDEQRIQ